MDHYNVDSNDSGEVMTWIDDENDEYSNLMNNNNNNNNNELPEHLANMELVANPKEYVAKKLEQESMAVDSIRANIRKNLMKKRNKMNNGNNNNSNLKWRGHKPPPETKSRERIEWSMEETSSLIKGYNKHLSRLATFKRGQKGIFWYIKNDEEFKHALRNRTVGQLKDKIRNLETRKSVKSRKDAAKEMKANRFNNNNNGKESGSETQTDEDIDFDNNNNNNNSDDRSNRNTNEKNGEKKKRRECKATSEKKQKQKRGLRLSISKV